MQAAGDEGSIAAAGEPDAGTVGCRSHLTAWIAVFAVLQLGLSQIPKFEHLWWVTAHLLPHLLPGVMHDDLMIIMQSIVAGVADCIINLIAVHSPSAT